MSRLVSGFYGWISWFWTDTREEDLQRISELQEKIEEKKSQISELERQNVQLKNDLEQERLKNRGPMNFASLSQPSGATAHSKQGPYSVGCWRQDCMQMTQRSRDLEQQLKHSNDQLRVYIHAECQRPGCIQMVQRIKKLEQDLEHANEKLRKLTPMKQMAQQHGGDHDQLSIEYEEMWTNPAIILDQLEQHFDDDFDAKGFLSDLFTMSYEKSKEHLMNFLCERLEELYKVQEDEAKKAELEDLSCKFGLLLHSIGAKMKTDAVIEVSKAVKREMSQLPRFIKAKSKLQTNDLVLKNVVEVAWKFVTQPKPVVVSLPKTYDSELHYPYFGCWDESQRDFQPLIYARPVLYRSYHGVPMSKGFVGNKSTDQTCFPNSGT